MFNNLFLKTIRDYRYSILGWGIGLMALTVMYISFYPSIKESGMDLNNYLEKMPDAIKAMLGDNDFNTPTGYINTEFFSIMGPILFMIFAIGYGSNAIAGEEDKGTLDVLLAYPISRAKVLLQKVAGLLVLITILGLIFYGALTVGSTIQSMNIDLLKLAAAVTSLGLLALFYGMFSLMLGCIFGNRGLSVGLTSALVVGSYVFDTFGKTVGALKPLRKFTPFFYYNENNPLVNGLDIVHVLILGGGIVLCLLVGFYFFQKRDLNI